MIADRMADGKAIAKQREGYQVGRPKTYGKKQIEHALSMLEDHSYSQVEAKTGISKSTLVWANRKAKAVEGKS